MASKPKAARKDSLRQLQAALEDVDKETAAEIDNMNKWIASLISDSQNAARRLVNSHTTVSGRPLTLKGPVGDLPSNLPTHVLTAVVFLGAKDLIRMLLEEHQFGAAMAQYFFAGYLAHDVLASSHVGKSTSEVLAAYLRISGGGKKGSQTTNEAHAELQPGYQAKVDQQMDGGLSYTRACSKVAESEGVNERTVRTHTKNRRPQNRGRRR